MHIISHGNKLKTHNSCHSEGAHDTLIKPCMLPGIGKGVNATFLILFQLWNASVKMQIQGISVL